MIDMIRQEQALQDQNELIGKFNLSGLVRLVLVIAAFFLPASICSASAIDVYVAQNSVGLANGADCADARPVTWLNSAANWGSGSSQIGPGTTVHLCGTISQGTNAQAVVAQASGTSGHPITIKFEPGAILSALYWGSGGAISLAGQSFIVVDGGMNGIIENTQNGTNRTYQASSSGVYAHDSPGNYEIKNLTIRNIFVHNPPIAMTSIGATSATCAVNCNYAVGSYISVAGSSSVNCDFQSGEGGAPASPVKVLTTPTLTTFTYASVPGCAGATGGSSSEAAFGSNYDVTLVIGINTGGSNTLVHDNVIHDAGTGINEVWTVGMGNTAIYNNTITNVSWGYALAGGGGTVGSSGPFSFHDNTIRGYANWDTVNNQNHHDGAFCYSGNPTPHITALNIYNNLFDDGGVGTSYTAHIFFAGNGAGSQQCMDSTSQANVFNNVLISTQPVANGVMCLASGQLFLANNTIIDTNSADVSSGQAFGYSAGNHASQITLENNVSTGFSTLVNLCGVAATGACTGLSSLVVDYNLYANGGASASFICNDSVHFGPSQFSSWQACVSGDSHGSYHVSAGLNSVGVPQPGSAVIGAGTNLTSLCGTLPALCLTTSAGNTVTPVARPSSGAWDAGAYQHGISAQIPNPPTGLIVH